MAALKELSFTFFVIPQNGFVTALDHMPNEKPVQETQLPGWTLSFVAKANSPHSGARMDRCVETYQLIIWTSLVFSSFCCVKVSYERGSQWWQSEPAYHQAESRAAHQSRPDGNLISSFHICFLLFTAIRLHSDPTECFVLHLCSAQRLL